MDIARLRAAEYQLRHRHDDGSWADMVESPVSHHGPVEHDAERLWGRARLFRCDTCEESVLVAPADADGNPIETT